MGKWLANKVTLTSLDLLLYVAEKLVANHATVFLN